MRLSFDRWLGVRIGDTASIKVPFCDWLCPFTCPVIDIQVCIPSLSSSCTTLWSASTIQDTAWKRLIYGLPLSFGNLPAVEVRATIDPLIAGAVRAGAAGGAGGTVDVVRLEHPQPHRLGPTLGVSTELYRVKLCC
jgi:hypothetical protein